MTFFINFFFVEMLCDVNLSVIIIVALAVLHNYSLMRNLPDVPTERHIRVFEIVDVNVNDDNILNNRGNPDHRMRNTIIEIFFNNNN